MHFKIVYSMFINDKNLFKIIKKNKNYKNQHYFLNNLINIFFQSKKVKNNKKIQLQKSSGIMFTVTLLF